MPVTDGDTVTIQYTGRLSDGTVIDTSSQRLAIREGLTEEHPDRDFEPLTLTIGEGEVIEGLQEALEGLEEGDQATVEIPPEKAYGPYRDDRLVEYDRGAFEEMLGDREIEAGFEVEVKESGLPGRVTEFDADTVTVDFNYELAGESLEFELEVVEIE